MSNEITIINVRRNVYRVKIENYVPGLAVLDLSTDLKLVIPQGRNVNLAGYRCVNLSNEIFILRIYTQRNTEAKDYIDVSVPARYAVEQLLSQQSNVAVPNGDLLPLDVALDAFSDTDLSVKFAGVIVDGQVNIDLDFIIS
jgi:DNA-directed RNA polymerase subunit L